MTKDEIAKVIYEGCASEGVGELFEGDTKFEDLPRHIADSYRRVAATIEAGVVVEAVIEPLDIGKIYAEFKERPEDIAPMSGETNEAKP